MLYSEVYSLWSRSSPSGMDYCVLYPHLHPPLVGLSLTMLVSGLCESKTARNRNLKLQSPKAKAQTLQLRKASHRYTGSIKVRKPRTLNSASKP